MKITSFSYISQPLFFIYIIVGMVACQSPNNTSLEGSRYPIALDTPPGLLFDCLIYENNFDQLPQDGLPEAYVVSTKDAQKGFVFRLDNLRQYSPGLQAFVKEPTTNQWFRLSVDACKAAEDIMGFENTKGIMVVSWHRKDSTIDYQQYPLVAWLKKHHRHLVNHWQNVCMWSPVPDFVQAGDVLKVYLYNPYGGPILMDNLKVERWTTVPSKERGLSDASLLLQQNYHKSAADRKTASDSVYQDIEAAVVVNRPEAYSFLNIYGQQLSKSALEDGGEINVKITVSKPHRIRFYGQSSQLVVSVERANKAIYWKGVPIEAKMLKGGQQVVDQWMEIAHDYRLPNNLLGSDILKVYLWNQQGLPLYIRRAEIKAYQP
jgi:hypothetical protein